MTVWCGLLLILAWFTIKWVFRCLMTLLVVKMAQNVLEGVKKDGKV